MQFFYFLSSTWNQKVYLAKTLRVFFANFHTIPCNTRVFSINTESICINTEEYVDIQRTISPPSLGNLAHSIYPYYGNI